MATLREICKFQSGGTPSKNNKSFYGGNIPWITTVSLIGDYINENNAVEWITDDAIENSAAKIVPKNSVMIGTRVGIGKTAINRVEMSTSQDIISLIDINEQNWDKEFLCLFLLSKKEYLLSQARGATIKGIKIETIADLVLPDLSLAQQHEIVSTLNSLQSIIAHRKQQFAKLDELVKARFVEMFGDPVSNNMNWDTQSVESVCSGIYGGGTPSKAHPEYYENGDIPWVSSKDMKTDIITESQIYINHLGVENSTAKMVPVNSVIMVIRSGILKHTLPVAINAVPITVNQDLKVFLPDKCITAVFLSTLFKMLEQDILSGVRAVTADNIEFNSLKQRQIIVPPIDLQKQFTAFIGQLNKSKVAVQKSLDEAQLLFDSLMQEYFG